MERLFDIRLGTQSDHPLVYATLLKSYRATSPLARLIDRDTFFRQHHRVVEAELERGLLLVAFPPDDSDTILGYSLTEPARHVAHYVYVKPAFRRHGVAAALLEHLGQAWTYTHLTGIVRDELAPKLQDCVFDPYRL